MAFDVVLQVPEAPLKEEWAWLTDVATSYDGTEDAIPLLRYPRRMFTGQFLFTETADLRRHLAMATKRYRTEFGFPLFQYQTKLKAAASAGSNTVSVNARRGDFKTGVGAIIVEGATYEEVEVAVVTETSLQFVDNLANAYTKRAIVCPLATVYTPTGAGISRTTRDNGGTASFVYVERLPTLPFVNELNEATIATFESLPLLPYVPIGTNFNSSVATGLESVDYVGTSDFVSPWTYEQWAYSLTFNANRIGNVDDWEWWQKFADQIQGSQNPFLFPTNRDDLDVVVSATAGGTTIRVRGTEYSDHYWGHGGFSRIFIDTAAGRHYARVTGVAVIGGNDRLTFTPALPGGAGWASGQTVGFLLKVRNAVDKIDLTHYGLTTEIGLTVRTVV